jgi:hypothetical protein
MKMDWSKYENVPFAVLMHSPVAGWIEMGRPDSPRAAWEKYEAVDASKKILINYGMTLAECG